MNHFTTLGCIAALYVAFTANVNGATVQLDSTLDLTDLQYPVTVNGVTGNAAAELLRFDLGTGWSGELEVLLTTGNYSNFTTVLGVALTTAPNDALYNNPGAFLQLADSNTTAIDFFNNNVNDWVFYAWGAPGITAGGTSNITNQLDSVIEMNPDEHYYAFIAGGSFAPTSVDVSMTVSTVPLPAAFWLFGSGFIGLIGLLKRGKNQVYDVYIDTRDTIIV